MGRMVKAVESGDRDKMLDALLMKIAETLDGTDSGRDIAALAIKFVDVLDRMNEDDRGNVTKKKREQAKVSTFEAITSRRTERRKTAEG